MSKCTEKAQLSSFRGPEAVLAEFMLILGIHFHFEERDELESLIRNQLNISDFQIKLMTISRLKQVFDQDLYSTETLTKLAISVPATPKLSANNTAMGLFCQSFLKKLDIDGWKSRQLFWLDNCKIK